MTAETDDDLTPEQLWQRMEEAEQGSASTPDPAAAAAAERPDATASEGEDAPDADADDDPSEQDGAVDPAMPDDEVRDLTHRLRSEQGRVNAAERNAAASRERIKALQAKLASVSPSAAKAADPDAERKRQERIARAKEDYPDLVGPLVDQIEDLSQRERQREEEAQRSVAADKSELDRLVAREEERFAKEHPDGRDLLAANRDTLMAWLNDQPKWVYDTFAANAEDIVDADAASKVVGMFKASLTANGSQSEPTPPEDTRRRRQAVGAATIPNRPAVRATGAPDPDDPDPEVHWRHMEEVERRRGG